MNHLKQWWLAHLTWITGAAYFFLPSVQTWMNAHPKTLFSSVLGVVVAAILKQSPVPAKVKTLVPAIILAVALTASCNVSTVQAYINLAVNIALQVASLAGLPATAVTQISADTATANKYISDLSSATALAEPKTLAKVDAALTATENDLTALLNAARVVDPAKQKAIQASIGIAVTAIESLYQLENAKQPSVASQVARKTASVLTAGAMPKRTLSPSQLKSLYNQTVSAYPSAQLK